MCAEFCQRLFLHLLRVSYRFLSFNLLLWCVTLTDLHILKNPCIPGINPTWSWCMSFLMCCWILFARIFLRTFASMFISDIGLWFYFFVLSLSGFSWPQYWWQLRISVKTAKLSQLLSSPPSELQEQADCFSP